MLEPEATSSTCGACGAVPFRPTETPAWAGEPATAIGAKLGSGTPVPLTRSRLNRITCPVIGSYPKTLASLSRSTGAPLGVESLPLMRLILITTPGGAGGGPGLVGSDCRRRLPAERNSPSQP